MDRTAMNTPIERFHADVKRFYQGQTIEPQIYKSQADRWNERDDVVMSEPHRECEWKVGDTVKFTNDYGVEFGPRRVVGFTKPENELHGRFVYIDSDSPWFPVNPEQLSVWVGQ